MSNAKDPCYGRHDVIHMGDRRAVCTPITDSSRNREQQIYDAVLGGLMVKRRKLLSRNGRFQQSTKQFTLN